MNIDQIRKWYLAFGEWIDAWRIIPRVIVAGYAYLMVKMVMWYMSLRPYILENCTSTNITDCIVQAPTTQHAALLTAVISIAAAIFGFYANTGKKWDSGFIKWNKDDKTKSEKNSDANNSTSE